MKVRVLVRFAAINSAFAFAALVIPHTASASPFQRFLAFDQNCADCNSNSVDFAGLNFARNFGFEHTDLAFNSFDGFNGKPENPFEGGDITLSRGLFDQPYDGDTWLDDNGGTSPTPEPGTLLLLGSGLLGLGAITRKFGPVR